MQTKVIKFESVNRAKKVWVAQILGEDPRYGLAREFIGRRTWDSKCYYSFEAEITKPGVYEVKHPGSHKYSRRLYYKWTGVNLEPLGEVEEGEPLPAQLKTKILEAILK